MQPDLPHWSLVSRRDYGQYNRKAKYQGGTSCSAKEGEEAREAVVRLQQQHESWVAAHACSKVHQLKDTQEDREQGDRAQQQVEQRNVGGGG
jgi:hypothetical protein